eukprot:Awhi_evm1s2793
MSVLPQKILRVRNSHISKVLFKSTEDIDTDEEYHLFLTACGSRKRAMQAGQLIRSVYETSTHRNRIHIHITHDGTKKVKKWLLDSVDLAMRRGYFNPNRIRFTNSVTTISENLKNEFHQCATSRLMLATEHPDIDYGLYLDSDTYVVSDITPLFREIKNFNSTQWAGMSYNALTKRSWYPRKQFKGPFYKPFGVNSGVFLVNFTRWRQSGFTEFSLNYNDFPIHLGDQDIINAYFGVKREQMYLLSCEWNYRTDLVKTKCLDHIYDAKILHGSRGSFYNSHPRNLFKGYGLLLGYEQDMPKNVKDDLYDDDHLVDI